MPQPEAPAARSGAIQGAAYSESASNGASMSAPARSLYPQTRVFQQPARPSAIIGQFDLPPENWSMDT